MALRRSKRQQREQELLVLTSPSPDTRVSSDDEAAAPAQSAFAAVCVVIRRLPTDNDVTFSFLPQMMSEKHPPKRQRRQLQSPRNLARHVFPYQATLRSSHDTYYAPCRLKRKRKKPHTRKEFPPKTPHQ